MSLGSDIITHSRENIRPLLPVEVLEQILSEVWSGPLTRKERTALFASLCLVNVTWLHLFIHLALRDVHILNKDCAIAYIRLLRPRTRGEKEDDNYAYLLSDAAQSANELCRSITFHVDAHASCHPDAKPAIKLYSDGDPSASAISATLYGLVVMNRLPNIRRVAVEYTDWGFDDIFDQYRFMMLPAQVTDIEVRFWFSPRFARMLDKMRWRYEMGRHGFGRYTLANVHKVTVIGATTAFAAGLLAACPSADMLVIDEYIELPVLPRYIRTVMFQDSKPNMFKPPGKSSDWHMVARAASGSTRKADLRSLAEPLAEDQRERNRRRLVNFCLRTGVTVLEA